MKKIAIVGGGTAGLVTGLILRRAFPHHAIKIIYSSKIGIVGVGEGSTEHWRSFMEMCDIPLLDLLVQTRATHKNGIRFENWTNHTPDYFHSVGSVQTTPPFRPYTLYGGLLQDGKLLTENISSRGMIENRVPVNGMHQNVNQYHFDTFKLNEFLTGLCIQRGIEMVDDDVSSVSIDSETGYINSVLTEKNNEHDADFWVDASGLRRALISEVSEAKWNSYSEYLMVDSAIAFPTPSDESGQIRPYTRARAMDSGWIWEIPTQDRRGNGYAHSSSHCSIDEAIQTATEKIGKGAEGARVIKFHPGALDEMWVKNCAAVGLASAFVEPLEATSIGSTIQQAKCLAQNLATFQRGNTAQQKQFNMQMNSMMENILCMISLHYVSDRRDTPFWRDVANCKKPDYLLHLLSLWSERPPFPGDIKIAGYEMFGEPHFYHVANGQGVLNSQSARRMLVSFALENEASQLVSQAKLNQTDHERIDHAESLKQIQI